MGYESTVAAILVIATAIILSVLVYWGRPPVFIAYGVAMTGIGMLTLTGNTISMDVFGPVADNANGIGEMGYDTEAMETAQPGSYKRARQILADLDAVGNTTKAETKGIAIGSAVIAAVSLFASFIAVIAVGSEDKLQQMTEAQYNYFAGFLTVANPLVLIGLLIGGAIPFLFSSMLIRAVGRAAFFIVKECRMQFKDPEIMAGTKKPDYGRVVAHLHQHRPERAHRPGTVLAILAPLCRRLPPGARCLGRLPGRHDPRRAAPGGVHGQRGRGLGQRQEDDRGRHLRRQGLRGPQGQRHRRHGGRPAEGHRRSGHQPAGQGDEHGQPLGPGPGAGLQRGRRSIRMSRNSNPAVGDHGVQRMFHRVADRLGRGGGLRVGDPLGRLPQQAWTRPMKEIVGTLDATDESGHSPTAIPRTAAIKAISGSKVDPEPTGEQLVGFSFPREKVFLAIPEWDIIHLDYNGLIFGRQPLSKHEVRMIRGRVRTAWWCWRTRMACATAPRWLSSRFRGAAGRSKPPTSRP